MTDWPGIMFKNRVEKEENYVNGLIAKFDGDFPNLGPKWPSLLPSWGLTSSPLQARMDKFLYINVYCKSNKKSLAQEAHRRSGISEHRRVESRADPRGGHVVHGPLLDRLLRCVHICTRTQTMQAEARHMRTSALIATRGKMLSFAEPVNDPL